jgi:hypothetical protein
MAANTLVFALKTSLKCSLFLPRPFAAKVRQVQLNLALQRFFGLLERAAYEVRHPPGAFVRDLQVSLDGLRRKPTLGVREHHERMEPERERNLRLLKDRACERRDLE